MNPKFKFLLFFIFAHFAWKINAKALQSSETNSSTTSVSAAGYEYQNSGYGNVNHDPSFRYVPCPESSTNKFRRPMLKWGETNTCFYIYDQGPCKSGEWIIWNRAISGSECKPNPCLHLTLEEPSKDITSPPQDPIEIFWFKEDEDETCFQTFTQSFCPKNEYVSFMETMSPPICFQRNPEGNGGTIDGMARPACPPGTKVMGNDCVPVGVEFD